jgi:hypothetical protein
MCVPSSLLAALMVSLFRAELIAIKSAERVPAISMRFITRLSFAIGRPGRISNPATKVKALRPRSSSHSGGAVSPKKHASILLPSGSSTNAA